VLTALAVELIFNRAVVSRDRHVIEKNIVAAQIDRVAEFLGFCAILLEQNYCVLLFFDL